MFTIFYTRLQTHRYNNNKNRYGYRYIYPRIFPMCVFRVLLLRSDA